MEEPSRNARARAENVDCRNCQRRGLRCSQTLPACQQCLQRGLHCRFPSLRGGPSAWRASVVPPTSIARNTAPNPALTNATIRSSSPDESTTSVSYLRQGLTDVANSISVPTALNVGPFRDNVRGSWLLSHYAHRPALQQIIVASAQHSFGDAAVSAVQAMSAAMFARFYKLPLWQPSGPLQPPYCEEYASAVQALSAQIPVFQLSSSEEVLVPVLLLLITDGWLKGQSPDHYSGLEQLVKLSNMSLLRPSRFDLFREIRWEMVWHAISRGDRTLFGEEWWKGVPFAMTPATKVPSDYLVDYMTDIAALFRDGSRLPLEAREDSGSDIAYRARAILHQLFSWRWWWQARNHHKTSEVDASETGVFETVLQFTEPHLVYEIWLCNALVILILGVLNPRNVPKEHIAPFRLRGSLWKPCESLSIQEPAAEICRSLEYQLDHLSTPAPAHEWAMPLALAYVTLSSTDPVARWVYAKVLNAPETRSIPWLMYIERFTGRDENVPRNVFACWPIDKH